MYSKTILTVLGFVKNCEIFTVSILEFLRVYVFALPARTAFVISTNTLSGLSRKHFVITFSGVRTLLSLSSGVCIVFGKILPTDLITTILSELSNSSPVIFITGAA